MSPLSLQTETNISPKKTYRSDQIHPLSRVCCNGRAKAQAAASAAERSHPTSKVRGRNREDPMPEGRRPRGVTPRPRSGAAAKSTGLRWRRNGPEELPRVRSQGWQRKELPCIRGQGRRPGGDTQRPRSGAATRGVTHVRGQGQWPGGPTPHPRSRGCTGAGEPRGAIPR